VLEGKQVILGVPKNKGMVTSDLTAFLMAITLGTNTIPLATPSVQCHGEFGTPNLWHPHAKYPREIGTPK